MLFRSSSCLPQVNVNANSAKLGKPGATQCCWWTADLPSAAARKVEGLCATSGVLGFGNARRKGLCPYPRSTDNFRMHGSKPVIRLPTLWQNQIPISLLPAVLISRFQVPGIDNRPDGSHPARGQDWRRECRHPSSQAASEPHGATTKNQNSRNTDDGRAAGR